MFLSDGTEVDERPYQRFGIRLLALGLAAIVAATVTALGGRQQRGAALALVIVGLAMTLVGTAVVVLSRRNLAAKAQAHVEHYSVAIASVGGRSRLLNCLLPNYRLGPWVRFRLQQGRRSHKVGVTRRVFLDALRGEVADLIVLDGVPTCFNLDGRTHWLGAGAHRIRLEELEAPSPVVAVSDTGPTRAGISQPLMHEKSGESRLSPRWPRPWRPPPH